jgi:hypothetical protein
LINLKVFDWMKRKIREEVEEPNPKKIQHSTFSRTDLFSETQKEMKASFLLSAFPKRKVITKLIFGEVTLREYNTINCDHPTVIEGFPK